MIFEPFNKRNQHSTTKTFNTDARAIKRPLHLRAINPTRLLSISSLYSNSNNEVINTKTAAFPMLFPGLIATVLDHTVHGEQ